jgi:hypothetical protein
MFMIMYSFVSLFCEAIFCGVPLYIFDKLGCATGERKVVEHWSAAQMILGRLNIRVECLNPARGMDFLSLFSVSNLLQLSSHLFNYIYLMVVLPWLGRKDLVYENRGELREGEVSIETDESVRCVSYAYTAIYTTTDFTVMSQLLGHQILVCENGSDYV